MSVKVTPERSTTIVSTGVFATTWRSQPVEFAADNVDSEAVACTSNQGGVSRHTEPVAS
jgi:hypothetical protein